jgi:oligoribonuclease
MEIIDKTPAYVFVDIETTGLSPTADRILEVGVATVNQHFQIIDQSDWLVVERGWRASLAKNEFVWDMHQKSGLLDEVREAYSQIELTATAMYSERAVSASIVHWLGARVEKGKMPMAGSSVHFDRSFLGYDMPEVVDMFSHRNIDVSTVKELVKVWYPEIAAEREATLPKASSSHRVLPDIHDTIDELKFYRNMVFIP